MDNSKRHSKPIGWADRLIDELRKPEMPPGAKTIDDYMEETGASRSRVARRLNEAVKIGKLMKITGIQHDRRATFYVET